MSALWEQPWFVATVAVAVAVPVVTVVLTEVIAALARRAHPAVRPLRLLRNYVVPAAAVLVLALVAVDGRAEVGGVRVVATLLGFLVVLLALSAFNAALFGAPSQVSWRARIPSIFVSIARLVLALVGLALIFSVVWGADVGGLFAALGVTSIVLGLALQGAVGSVVSGLLLLFEQPFRLGDVLQTSSARGRVVGVNWRAVHLQTDEGVLIIPNASLAGATFTNRSRSTDGFFATGEFTVAGASPRRVIELVEEVAGGLPGRRADVPATASYEGGDRYTVSVPVTSRAAVGPAAEALREWMWYATRRAGLGDTGAPATDEERAALAARVAAALLLPAAEAERLAPDIRRELFAPGEVIQHEGRIATAMRVVLRGRVRYDAPAEVGAAVGALRLEEGESFGQTALTRDPSLGRFTAQGEVEVASIPRESLDAVLQRVPSFARTVGLAIDLRRSALRAAAGAASGAAAGRAS